MMAAFRRQMVVTLGLGACSVYDSSLLAGHGGAPPVGSSGSEAGGRESSTEGGAPSGTSGTLGGRGGTSAASGAKDAAGRSNAGGNGEVGGSDARSGEGGASGESDGGEGGVESMGGAGESGGGAPSAGSGGASSSGSGGIAGFVGAAGNETCSGCARLSVPLTSAAIRAHFVITLDGSPDFTAATVHYRVSVHAGTTGLFTGYLQDASGFTYQVLGSTELSALSGWQDLAWVVPSPGADFDATDIRLLGIEIAGETGAISPTVVYVDSVTVPEVALAINFDDASSVVEGPQTGYATELKMWLNADSDAGSSLSWLGE
jgi:hypothetical protein